MIAGTNFRLVDVDAVWPAHAERAARCGAPAGHLDWVVGECRAHRALCLECDDGIVIFTLGISERGTRMRVLLAVGQPGALRRRAHELAKVARAAGATEVSFRSDRRAWQRMGWASNGDRYWRAA